MLGRRARLTHGHFSCSPQFRSIASTLRRSRYRWTRTMPKLVGRLSVTRSSCSRKGVGNEIHRHNHPSPNESMISGSHSWLGCPAGRTTPSVKPNRTAFRDRLLFILVLAVVDDLCDAEVLHLVASARSFEIPVRDPLSDQCSNGQSPHLGFRDGYFGG